MKSSWYVLYTASRAEKQVEKRLVAENVITYLPLHLTPRRWSDRVKLVEMPLFNSYIFVKTSDEILRTLTKINGISRIVFYNGSPARVKETEISSIKRFIEEAAGKECKFEINETVKIAGGPLKDIEGQVKKADKHHLVLYLEKLGMTVKICSEQVSRR